MTMEYVSTRGNAPQVSFCETLLEGLAPDGGLRLPEKYTHVSKGTPSVWRGLTYAELAYEIPALFVDVQIFNVTRAP